ncbi:unnamed protein product [Polarella glacialis]|uniref:PPIase cyclophilin-type domain-containing protein n=1 Tax=Polarella glacialis TaxID=89957 RepID=A0A813L267_POLGL|nr:unnamed protein product [Polarella glacialis]
MHIVKYIKRFGVHPCHGGKLEVSELVPLHFHKNAQGQLHCPVTMKVLGNNTPVCANMSSGHVYSTETVLELNKKTKNWCVVVPQDLVLQGRHVCVCAGPMKLVGWQSPSFRLLPIQLGSDAEATAAAEKADPEGTALDKVSAKKAAAERKERADQDAEAYKNRKLNDRYSGNEVSASFTSTSENLRTENTMRKLTEEEELQDLYDTVRKNKAKGYVRFITTGGMLNIELHTDIVPRTTDNFLRLCERNYYDNTIFHRLIKNFMLQGGDPTGTGKGGQSGFEGGRAFKDEYDSRLMHQGPGVVSMANNGKNTNRSQFFVSLKSCQHLDMKHSVFGRVVGGLQLLEVLNGWETDSKDKPTKEIRLIRTEVFKNPFKEALAEAAKPKDEKVIDPVATWFSNRRDPMVEHKNRTSGTVGKYLEEALPLMPGEKRKAKDLPAEEVEYANVTQKSKKVRTSFDFSKW